jgi:hypothetical protein
MFILLLLKLHTNFENPSSYPLQKGPKAVILTLKMRTGSRL